MSFRCVALSQSPILAAHDDSPSLPTGPAAATDTARLPAFALATAKRELLDALARAGGPAADPATGVFRQLQARLVVALATREARVIGARGGALGHGPPAYDPLLRGWIEAIRCCAGAVRGAGLDTPDVGREGVTIRWRRRRRRAA